MDFPNAMDGVAGLTQDAVMPGESFVYRFVVDQVGTYWYHFRQVSHEQVRRGLLGAIVVEASPDVSAGPDVVAVLHQYAAVPTLNGDPGTTVVPAQAGDSLRVRVVNTDNALTALWVTGAPFAVAAVDGTDQNQPTPVTDRSLGLTAWGHVDLQITVPEGGARRATVSRSLRSAVNSGADSLDGALWARFESRTVAERYWRLERPKGIDPQVSGWFALMNAAVDKASRSRSVSSASSR
ncbi:MAG: multicopper oxidase domain-containing protein [Nocardioides sp.]